MRRLWLLIRLNLRRQLPRHNLTTLHNQAPSPRRSQRAHNSPLTVGILSTAIKTQMFLPYMEKQAQAESDLPPQGSDRKPSTTKPLIRPSLSNGTNTRAPKQRNEPRIKPTNRDTRHKTRLNYKSIHDDKSSLVTFEDEDIYVQTKRRRESYFLCTCGYQCQALHATQNPQNPQASM